ncbi:uncharacterized protein LOC114760920 [Neltuma alba]|uniref:uncharacterized protein LOC114760920 n=1 Tax=Neltuma alba TaxID=207710 RepID=UPI0010A4EC87|nr:uncharacterized protein LOC114760920 [Prosopis alba]
MLVILRPCNPCYFPDCTAPWKETGTPSNALLKKSYLKPLPKPQKFSSFATTGLSDTSISLFSRKFAFWSTTRVVFCSKNGEADGFSSTQLSQESPGEIIQEPEKLGLLNKPSPIPDKNGFPLEVDMESEKATKDEEEALAPFLKFFKGSDAVEVAKEEGGASEVFEEKSGIGGVNEEAKKINVEYYEPKPGDFVVGIVVSGNENRLDVNVGADILGTMLTKEVLPLYGKETEYLLCDLNKDSEKFMVPGKMGLVRDDDVISGIPPPGRPVVEVGTILFAEVLGRTLSGRPLLSTRRLFRRMAWHRVMQIKQLNEPIEVRITEWNTGGLLTRIEGLRAFLPKAELMKRVNCISELKDYVGCQMFVQISRVDEATNNLILNEREAWEKLYLREGTLLDGTVKKIFPYGAQVRIGETNRSGLLHVSNITRAEVTSVSDVLSVDEKLRVLVVKSLFPDKISLSIADLESEPGLFLSNKERVFHEAEMMARKYKEKLPPSLTRRRSDPLPRNSLPFENETLYANWNWFKFEKE